MVGVAEAEHERGDRREDPPVDDRHVDLADLGARVEDVSRGRKPSWIAWRVTENAPEMTACEAMIAATVATITIGICSQPGNSRKNGLSTAPGSSRITAPWPM